MSRLYGEAYAKSYEESDEFHTDDCLFVIAVRCPSSQRNVSISSYSRLKEVKQSIGCRWLNCVSFVVREGGK